MALRNPSLFLYGFQVTAQNSSIDFRAVALETPRQATLNNGFYSLTSLMAEIKRAMEAQDGANSYTVTADRNFAGGTQNRVTIQTSGTHLELLFGTGPRVASSVYPLIGFNNADYTGATSYTGSSSCGTVLIPNMIGYQYLGPDFNRRVFGSINIASSGLKEAIVYNIQRFWQVQFKFIPESTWVTGWTPLMTWMMQQRLIEFTPDITDADIFYEGTLESTSADGKGLAFIGREMLPEFPFQYDTGLMVFRQNTAASTFLT